jgi:hypothetical protein
MDKRKNPRFESHLEAKLIATDNSSHACLSAKKKAVAVSIAIL